MKAKLSFLALPISMGLAMIFVLAACGSGSPTAPPPGGNIPGSSFVPSSDSNSGGIAISGFSVEVYDGTDKVTIQGIASYKETDRIARIKFEGLDNHPSWISYDGNPVPANGTININDPPQKSFNFDSKYIEIDLNNEAIECDKNYNVQVTVWTKADSAANASGTFKKPSYMCNKSSSGGAGVSSSSVGWKFGQPTSGKIPTASVNTNIPIGSGSFTVLQQDLAFDVVDQPDLRINGGKLRWPVSPCGGVIDDNIVPGVIYPQREGSTECLGNTPATATKLSDLEDTGISKGDYFLVYLDGGSVYLLFFAGEGGGSMTKYPIEYKYWLAEEHP